MDEATTPLPGGDVTTIPSSSTGEWSIMDAARSIADFRYKRDTGEAAPEHQAESAAAEPATAETESAPAADATPEQGTIAEDQTAEPEVPAIEPPRSWSKEAHERWSKLDRETQEFLASRDSEDQKAIKRSLNEAAEARKAAQAELEKAAQERKTYETKQAAYTKSLEEALQADFADLQSMADVRKLQAEDPFRFQQWQLRQMELSAAQAEKQALEQRASQERVQKRSAYEGEQHKLLTDLIPEMKDPTKGAELREKVVKMLTDDRGLSVDQLSRWMADDVGHEILSNAAWQKLMVDGLRYQEVQKAKATIVAKPLPPAQRPGSQPAGNTSNAAKIQALQKQLDNATGMQAIRLAAEMTKLKRAG